MATVSNAAGLVNTKEAAVKAPLHPVWYPPEEVAATARVPPAERPAAPVLSVMNSLTDRPEPFAALGGRTVKWYTCGPTVYDRSHMGHARAYLTFDILRRITEDYFGYTVDYHLNITDIDDKIIKRARVNKLVDDYRNEAKPLDALIADVAAAVALSEASLEKRAAQLAVPLPEDANSRVRDERDEKLKELELKKGQLAETKQKIAVATTAKDAEALLTVATGLLGEYLDSKYGDGITDQGIFDAHAKKYEAEFFEDMHRLGVRDPDVLTRVTEFVPEIVEYVQKIIDNGFAYVGTTSVFFDTQAFLKAGHNYPKNRKTKEAADAQDDTTAEEMAEGEGALSAASASEKRSPNDFALWKFSKPGEPEWDSPWGKGRPGWHIECSVVASHVLGENVDIHAGGCDLRFPHHDNELAQSEAYWGNHQWVNYFFHCGHLHIKGLKMSKSLKNFITIRQALDDKDGMGITPRQMRLLFLAFEWNRDMSFSDQSIGDAREKERVLRACFGSIDAELRKDFLLERQGLIDEHDKALRQKCLDAENEVHAALCNNFDTVTALDSIMSLVSAVNAYFQVATRPNATLLRRAGRYATKILRVFGVVGGSDDIGFGEGSAGAADSKFVPVVDALVEFRDVVRNAVRDKAPPQVLLQACDDLRDGQLPPLGIRLEDKPSAATIWKKDDPAVLLKELADKKVAAAAEAKKKLVNGRETKRKLLAKWEKVVQPPTEFFKLDPAVAAKYTAFDAETGLPTANADGTPVDEKQTKKLKKEQDKYAGTHKELVAKGGAAFVDSVRADIAAMDEQIAAL